MWYDGKIARKHSNCVDVWTIRLSRQTFHGNYLTWLYRLESLSKIVQNGGESAEYQLKI